MNLVDLTKKLTLSHSTLLRKKQNLRVQTKRKESLNLSGLHTQPRSRQKVSKQKKTPWN